MTWSTVTEYLFHRYPRICFIIQFLTRIAQRMPLLEQELSSLRIVLLNHSFSVSTIICLFLIALVLSVLPRFTASDYPFGSPSISSVKILINITSVRTTQYSTNSSQKQNLKVKF